MARQAGGTEIKRLRKRLGSRFTSNEAEYHGLILGLETALNLQCERLRVCGNSELVIKQLTGEFEVRAGNLRPLYEVALALLQRFQCLELVCIPRQHNQVADEEARQAALDRPTRHEAEQAVELLPYRPGPKPSVGITAKVVLNGRIRTEAVISTASDTYISPLLVEALGMQGQVAQRGQAYVCLSVQFYLKNGQGRLSPLLPARAAVLRNDGCVRFCIGTDFLGGISMIGARTVAFRNDREVVQIESGSGFEMGEESDQKVYVVLGMFFS